MGGDSEEGWTGTPRWAEGHTLTWRAVTAPRPGGAWGPFLFCIFQARSPDYQPLHLCLALPLHRSRVSELELFLRSESLLLAGPPGFSSLSRPASASAFGSAAAGFLGSVFKLQFPAVSARTRMRLTWSGAERRRSMRKARSWYCARAGRDGGLQV